MRKSSFSRRALLCAAAALAAMNMTTNIGQAAETLRPLTGQGDRTVVAHRGASAYLPEHSMACYTLAHAQGADYIEPDVMMTKDGVLVCVHDLYLESTTDVAARFPDRKRADGHYYAIDFTLAEIKSLNVFGRVPEAERASMKGHQIVTLEELILLVQRLNRATGRTVGLLVETKAPDFHIKEGKPLEKPLLEVLAKYGYTKPDSGVIIQSFDGPHLKRLRPFLSKGDFAAGSAGHANVAEFDGLIDVSVWKVAYSAFFNTQLDWVLRRAGITRLIVAGIVTNGGVASTVRDAHMRDYHVTVLADGCAAPTPAMHDAALADLKTVADIVTCRDLLDGMRR